MFSEFLGRVLVGVVLLRVYWVSNVIVGLVVVVVDRL